MMVNFNVAVCLITNGVVVQTKGQIFYIFLLFDSVPCIMICASLSQKKRQTNLISKKKNKSQKYTVFCRFWYQLI